MKPIALSPHYLHLLALSVLACQRPIEMVTDFPAWLNGLKDQLIDQGLMDFHTLLVREETRMLEALG
jgi:hypothetical protein